MSIHRLTVRQRDWSEAISGGLLAALLCGSILVGTVVSQEPETSVTQFDKGSPAEPDQSPEDQEYTGPAVTHLLGMSISEADEKGAVVREVQPLGPAAEAGIKEGDFILAVEGYKTKPYDKFLTILRDVMEKRKKGDKVEISVMRGDKTAKATLTERIGSEERRDDIQKLAEEYSDEQQSERRMEAAQEEGSQQGSLGDALAAGADRNGAAEESDSLGAEELLGPATAGRTQQVDRDYYFGSGGAYGGALTSAQQNEYDRLMRIQSDNGLTTAQQQRLDELTNLEFSRFDSLGELGEDESSELQELYSRRQNGDQLTSDDRARLRQLIGRNYSSYGDYKEQIQELQSMEQGGELNNRDQMRLDMLRQMGPGVADRVSDRSMQGLRDLAGSNSAANANPQRARLEQLASQSGQLSSQELAELRQLQMNSQSGLARQLRGEYQAAQQMMQSGQQLTPQQASRYQLLRRNIARFAAGAPRGSVPYPAAMNQPAAPQPGAMPGQQGASSGSGIGLGGQGGPAASGSGIGTSSGAGMGSAPSGGTVGGGGSGGGGSQ
ncbi:PDZ domain (Also known as DHR or GLGF) [Posidoniimonas polymericola]|uniref:PDZ domain (Also known as DHR or GLGF) n=1 Tax=Posidoniimonas polymericola TaxID=2528002 RepID=A0A5C5YSQ4_9BACT|nr:PDZ domain-containing protein [Posidoniimonas polymericola]TWT78034.1 PDZ domain (Also known as DHR or GLGF) [Posidoniimonas polymericola]